MINWFNIPDEGLSNGGLFEVKELEVTENGTYKTKGEMYNKVTVNVEGGGGESDFSTAVLSIVDEDGYPVNLNFATLTERGYSMGGYPNFNTTKDLTVILYKGTAMLELENLNNVNISVSGAIEDIGGNRYAITGDCTITISEGEESD